MKISRLLTIANALLFVILLVSVMGGAKPQSAQATGGTQISACKAKSGGALRVSSTCKSSEIPLTWNVQGPQGEMGQRGLQGLQGLQGTPASAATVESQTITFKYLSLRGGILGCSPGAPTYSNVGYVFPWRTSVDQDNSNSISYARNWTQIQECQITVKVLR